MLSKGIGTSYGFNGDACRVKFSSSSWETSHSLQLTIWSHKFSWRLMLSSVWPIAMHRRNMTATGPANLLETSDSHSAWCPLITLFVVIWDLLPYALLRSILSQRCRYVVMWRVHVCDMSARLVYSMPCIHILVYKLRYIREVSSILEYKRDI
jgi:hypothetical protein